MLTHPPYCELDLPRGALREYLLLAGVAAVYVADFPKSRCKIGATRDVLRSIQVLRLKRHDGVVCAWLAWVESRELAELIAAEASSYYGNDPNGLLDVSIKAAIRAVEAAAARMSVPLTEHTVLMQRVRRASFHVKQMIDDAHGRGDLKWFNTAFREWRLQAKAQGRVMSYKEARARLRKVVVQRVLAGDLEDAVALAPTIFPKLTPGDATMPLTAG